MKTPLLTVILGFSLLLATGCGERTGSSSPGAAKTNASTSGSSPLTAPVDYLGAVVKAQETAVKTVDTASLNHAIQIFRVEEGRNPKDLNELVQEKYLPRLPTVPDNLKILYDPNAGTVKIVRK